MIQNGDCVYFKRAKSSTARKAPEMEFKGHGFGVFLGHVPPFQKEPPKEYLMRLMGTIGFLTFDDVGEFLGNEQAALCVAKYEAKYMGAPLAPADPATPAEPVLVGAGQEGSVEHLVEHPESPLIVPQPPATPKIVNIHGQPIVSATPDETL